MPFSITDIEIAALEVELRALEFAELTEAADTVRHEIRELKERKRDLWRRY